MANLRILVCVTLLALSVPVINGHGSWRRFIIALQNGNATDNGNGVVILPINNNNNNNNGNGGNSEPIVSASENEILTRIQAGNLNSGVNGTDNGNGTVVIISEISPTKVTPQRIDQINRGVSTILNGVGSASLEQILRGSFMFTRNENVRTVANNVLDSIFGGFRRRY